MGRRDIIAAWYFAEHQPNNTGGVARVDCFKWILFNCFKLRPCDGGAASVGGEPEQAVPVQTISGGSA